MRWFVSGIVGGSSSLWWAGSSTAEIAHFSIPQFFSLVGEEGEDLARTYKGLLVSQVIK